MKLALSVAVLALVVVAVLADAPTPKPAFCDNKDITGKLSYKDLGSGKGWSGHMNCMKYHDCKGNKDNLHRCFWFIPLREYNPTARKCDWFWNVDCTASDPAK